MTVAPAATVVTAAPPRRAARAVLAQHLGVLSIAAVCLVLFVVFSVRTDAFFTTNNLVNVSRQVAPTVILAMAMTFVITTGAIDLSVGSIVGLTAASLALLAEDFNAVAALVLTLLIGLAIGVVNGVLTAYVKVQSFIVTLAALTAVRGIALLITEGYSTPIKSPFLLDIGNAKWLGIYVLTWIALVTVVGAWYVFGQTRFGRYVVAVGSNAEALRRAGVDIRRIQLAALLLTGVFGAVAGVATATRLASGSSNSGTGLELEVITAVVLGSTSLRGGRGSIVGSLFGAITLGIINNGLVLLKLDVYWVPIVQGAILVIAIVLNTSVVTRIVGVRR